MADFTGFYCDTANVLLGIRLNNNKEWFNDNKEFYKQYVHEPLSLLGTGIYTRMKQLDKSFDATLTISHARRKRISANAQPSYLCNKWFALQTGSESPALFFEISPDGYRYGLHYRPCLAAMKPFKESFEARKLSEWFLRQKSFKLETAFCGSNPYKCQYISLLRNMEYDSLFLQHRLLDVVAAGFKILYPSYLYFKNLHVR